MTKQKQKQKTPAPSNSHKAYFARRKLENRDSVNKARRAARVAKDAKKRGVVLHGLMRATARRGENARVALTKMPESVQRHLHVADSHDRFGVWSVRDMYCSMKLIRPATEIGSINSMGELRKWEHIKAVSRLRYVLCPKWLELREGYELLQKMEAAESRRQAQNAARYQK